jgi:phosphopantetheinyl transferase
MSERFHTVNIDVSFSESHWQELCQMVAARLERHQEGNREMDLVDSVALLAVLQAETMGIVDLDEGGEQ